MKHFDKVYIYFDTNMLERRHTNSSLFLSELTVRLEYFEIEQMIQDFSLQDKIQICIPEIVWMEIKKHMKEAYKSEKQAISSKIGEYKKIFGSLVDLGCEFKNISDSSSYEDYLEQITQDFLDNPRVSAKIISCPKDEITVTGIIDKAMYTQAPFVKVKSNKKEYTDAGLKDALIYETILQNSEDQLGVLISGDTDFEDLFRKNDLENLKLCKTIKEAKEVVISNFGITNSDVIEAHIKDNDYLLTSILTETDFGKVEAYKFDKIIQINNADIDEEASIKFSMYVNDEKFVFDVLYNLKANELIEASLADEEGVEENAS